MSMRYKDVYIPAEKAAEFEAVVGELGGTVRRGIPSREAPALFTEQAQYARGLVDQFKQDHDPETEEAIRSGLQNLLVDSFTLYDDQAPANPLKPNIDWRTVKREMIGYFEASLDEKRADFYYVNTPNEQPVLVAAGHDGGLSPRQVAVAIQTYGLADGKRMPAKAISQELGFASTQPVRDDLIRIKLELIRRRNIRGFVQESPEL